MNRKYDVIVVGGGAAGMMAASAAASAGACCLLLEAGPRVGRKILITGKGRCNITNSCTVEEILENVRRNKSFLYSSLYSFTNQQIIDFFEKLGVKTKVERGGRVFPVSDKAAEVADALEKELVSLGVGIFKKVKVIDIKVLNNKAAGVLCSDGMEYKSNKIILACGGASYPVTGSDGNGYELARRLGHDVIAPRGVLTGLDSSEKWIKDAMGLSLKNVNLSLYDKGRNVFDMQGEMLFTHYGISGPIVLTGSSSLFDSDFRDVYAKIDLKPALDEEKLDKRLIRDFAENSRKDFSNALDNLLPRKLIPVIVDLSGINKDKKVNQVTAQERRDLVELLKGLKLIITGARPVSEAIITAGGVKVSQINPSTMESKLVEGLFFCGEMIDVDANTGGFNLTIAFSTGHLAGKSATGGD
ncbi:MAG: NAD(P)/FAD-dependent oxidoreductase [Clostridia bacterium]|nr:NAD(P)/FAD-dependent oxidoreductase [Clostridia bacterium]